MSYLRDKFVFTYLKANKSELKFMVVLRVNNESKDESQKHKHKYLDEYANNKGNHNVI